MILKEIVLSEKQLISKDYILCNFIYVYILEMTKL